MAPAGVAQWVWASSRKPRGHQFDSLSGHMPGLLAGSPVEGVQRATNRCLSCTSTFLPLSFSLPSPLSKNK